MRVRGRLVAVGALLVSTLLVFTGCGGGSDGGSNSGITGAGVTASSSSGGAGSLTNATTATSTTSQSTDSVTSTTASASATGSGGAKTVGGTSNTGASLPLTPPSIPHQLCQLMLSCQEDIPNDRDSDERLACEFQVVDGMGASVYTGHAGVKRRGRSSRSYPKANYSVELWDQTGEEVSENLLGMGGESDWVLDGLWLDRSLMRNSLAYDLFRSLQIGRYAAEGRYCQLTLNGSARGLYRLGERIKRDDDRLDLPEDDASGATFVIKQHANGVLRMEVAEGFSGGSADQNNWRLIYPKQSAATPAQVTGVQDFLDGLAEAGEDEPDSIFTQYLDLDATADWILINELAKNIDAFHLSIHLYRSAENLAEFVPWDFDLSMGQPTVQGEAGNESPRGWIINRSRFHQQLLRAQALRVRLGERWADLRQGPLSDASVDAWLDSYAATLEASAVMANFAIWPMDQVDFQQIYPPYTLYEVESHSEEVTQLTDWVHARLVWMDANIDAYSD